MENIDSLSPFIEKYIQEFMEFLPSLFGALVLLFVGLWLIRFINKAVNRYFSRKDFDVTLEEFIASLIN